MKTQDEIKKLLTELEVHARIDVLAWLYANYPYEYDYATMSESLRRFYDPKAKRPNSQKD